MKEDVTNLGKLHNYMGEMVDMFVSDSVDLNQQLTHNNVKVSNLENKLGSIHAIDFKAQTDSQTLRKEMLELKQKCLEEERRYQEEIEGMQQSLEAKNYAEI